MSHRIFISPRTLSLFIATLILMSAATPSSYRALATAPSRTYAHAASPPSQRETMNELEGDRIREAQEISLRIAVFNKIIERRLMALRDPQAATSKEAQKQIEKWGELPTGTHVQLLSDISQLLDEAKTNIEDAEARKTPRKQLLKAVQLLNKEATLLNAALAPLRTSLGEDGVATAWLERISESVQEISEAAKGMTDVATPPTNRNFH